MTETTEFTELTPEIATKHEEATRSFSVETSKPIKIDSKVTACTQTPLDKIKNVAKALHSNGKDAEVEYIEKMFDSITNTSNQRKEFELVPDNIEPSQSYGKPKEPGSLANREFTVDAETSVPANSYQGSIGVTTEHVLDSSYGTIAQHVNFELLNELRESVYNAKFELDKITGVKDQHFESLEQSLVKTQEILDFERRNIILHNLDSIKQELEAVKVEELSPDDRKALWDAIHNIQCAFNLVNKAGYKDKLGDGEKLVQEYVTKALKLYPKLNENVRLQALSLQIFELSK